MRMSALFPYIMKRKYKMVDGCGNHYGEQIYRLNVGRHSSGCNEKVLLHQNNCPADNCHASVIAVASERRFSVTSLQSTMDVDEELCVGSPKVSETMEEHEAQRQVNDEVRDQLPKNNENYALKENRAGAKNL
ncbi:hypothetical protein GLOIN_2v1487200 [Rhizophagus irregularis DAOM 181602=DAOM 197198]|uniref:Uncharacterized protein n=1 Tax=Rhizophagus irregularis (strain DAOM 181602 / DAOM 197198 / MUCL 43194) TaxID=747089 RepID=A0A2P4P4A7_RHIID|nr:hypothetical protein GLOIN_2v1487200 [Rhizophagus irregularis DAOM 181602=DAOM 197198]POG60217.1 hypothetical protein GLOIN_2v1487200 [Rhizophagus irregularis DAOM 181602=DAOM 197198]|eukprot:XP_025167083.1 hypothetical protein GLOIN_2v1487200 [Rhizophagus irregularis DAOM 181602=DAOM 197198]